MDWARTMNILIVAFLILNLVFIGQLWLVPLFFDPANYISNEQVEAALHKLEGYGIDLAVKVPQRLSRVQALGVEKTLVGPEKVVAILGEEHTQTIKDNGVEYQSQLGKAVIHEDGRLQYISPFPPAKGSLSAQAARKQADKFLELTVGKPRDAVEGRTVLRSDGCWAVEYIQRWRRKNLATSSIIVAIDAGGSVTEMEYYWVRVIGFAGESLLTISAPTALSVAAPAMPADTTISALYISWRGMPKPSGQWQVSPVWVVESEAGSKYYINAHTGEFEGEDGLQEGNAFGFVE